MGDLIRQQRHFLQLFVQTTPAQRKALLQTITRDQVKSLSQIAHNIIVGTVPLTPSDKDQLKHNRRLVHLLGDKKLGYKHKQRLVRNKQGLVFVLVNRAVIYLETILQ